MPTEEPAAGTVLTRTQPRPCRYAYGRIDAGTVLPPHLTNSTDPTDPTDLTNPGGSPRGGDLDGSGRAFLKAGNKS